MLIYIYTYLYISKDFMFNLNDYLSLPEAAKFIGVSRITLKTWAEKGKIKSHKNLYTGKFMFDKKELEKDLLIMKGDQ